MRYASMVVWSAVAGFATTLTLAQASHAATINWKGHTWNVTGGGMAGVCQGNAANISIDTNGYLHMKITNNGGTWTAAEIFSTDKIGFGTYQWQIEGPTDKLDKNVVVGLFPYGPAGGLGSSGNNEIDIEFARWGNAAWDNGNYTVWPPTGSTTSSHTFELSLGGGTSLTTRFTWSSTEIDFATLSGFVAVGGTTGLLDSWTFAPANPTTRITQVAMPLGMNLWCFQNPPSDGQNVELIVRDFQFVPLGATVDAGAGGAGGSAGAGGSGGSGGAGGSGGKGGAGGSGGKGGAVGTDAAAGSGGASGAAGAAGMAAAAGGAGTLGSGGSPGNGGSAGTIAGGGAAGAAGLASGGAAGTSAAGAGGAAGSTAAAGSAGVSGPGGASGGGSAGASGAAVPAVTEDAGGCSCEAAGAGGARGGQLAIMLAGAMLGIRRRMTRRRAAKK